MKSVNMCSTWSEATNNNIHTPIEKGKRNEQNGKSRVYALHFSESLSLSFSFALHFLCVCVCARACDIFFSSSIFCLYLCYLDFM